MMRLVSANPGEPGALTRIHGGLRRYGVSGRCAFSGWRGRGDCSVSRTTAMKCAQALYLRTESPACKPAAPAGPISLVFELRSSRAVQRRIKRPLGNAAHGVCPGSHIFLKGISL
jgi:hypothetical protein